MSTSFHTITKEENNEGCISQLGLHCHLKDKENLPVNIMINIGVVGGGCNITPPRVNRYIHPVHPSELFRSFDDNGQAKIATITSGKATNDGLVPSQQRIKEVQSMEELHPRHFNNISSSSTSSKPEELVVSSMMTARVIAKKTLPLLQRKQHIEFIKETSSS